MLTPPTLAYVLLVQNESLSPLLATVALVIKKRCTVRLLIVKAGYKMQSRSM